MSINHLHIQRLTNDKPRAFRARGLLYLCILVFSWLAADASAARQASLVTAWPGAEIYELCGHEAVRISGDGIDSVWNFGIFDFNEPNFVYRFVKGETDYMVDGYPFAWFMPDYVKHGRRVEEQVLNLTPEEVERLHNLLRKNTLPPNNRYRYNYIKNNCSTQIAALLDSVGGKIDYTDTVRFSTYRDAMRNYHKNYPWYQFGIDLALGSGLEEDLSQKEELFIPVEFHRHAAKAFLPDGRPLVKATNVLYPGRDNAVEGPTPFLLTPLWFSIVVAAVSLLLICLCWRKNCLPKWWYALYFGVAGIAGCLVAFLVFISSHAATSPNLLIFWLNPLQLLVPLLLWWPRMRPVLSGFMWLNLAVVGMLVVLLPIFAKGQGSQTGFIILMGADILLAAYYLWVQHRSDRRAETPVKRSRKKPAAGKKNISAKKTNNRIKIRETIK